VGGSTAHGGGVGGRGEEGGGEGGVAEGGGGDERPRNNQQQRPGRSIEGGSREAFPPDFGRGGDDLEYDWEAISDQETDAVMKERVKKSTRLGYTSQNVSFMIWLFDGNRYHDFIKDRSLN
jgi:hypothetical protein